MTAVTNPPDRGAALSQSWLLAKRNLLTLTRRPDVITFIVIQPIMFTLLFVYVFGGAIQVPGVTYVNFLMPGVIVQTLAFDAPVTAIGLNDDLSKGVLDRFRSLPISRSAVLVGRLIADSIRGLGVLGLIIGVGYLVGFRFDDGILPALGAVVLAWLFAIGIAWGSAIVGMSVPNPEAVQAAVFTGLFPVVFVSSIFVPLQTMPGWLQPVAQHNPMTRVADAVRALSLDSADRVAVGLGEAVAGKVWIALAWSLGLIVLFVPLAVRRYRHLT